MKRSEKTECCVSCFTSFEDVKYHALNMCKGCYQSSKQPKVKIRKNSITQWTHCRNCKLAWGEKNEKGRLVTQGSNGYCKRCYMDTWLKAEPSNCQRCGKQIERTTKTLCKVCYDIERDEYHDRNPNARKSSSYKNVIIAQNKVLEYEEFELIRRLLGRFKLGSQTRLDFYKLADVYIDIFETDVALDAYRELEQVRVMLRRLKVIWQRNNEIRQGTRLAPVKKGRGRPRRNIEEKQN